MKRQDEPLAVFIYDDTILPDELWGVISLSLLRKRFITSKDETFRRLSEISLRFKHILYTESLPRIRGIQPILLSLCMPVEFFQCCRGLESLSLRHNKRFSNETIRPISVTLHTLILTANTLITNDALRDLPCLHSLALGKNKLITDEGVAHVAGSLTYLNLLDNDLITDVSLKKMHLLETLVLRNNRCITDDGIKNLVTLRHLYLRNNEVITLAGIQKLTKLRAMVMTKTHYYEYRLFDNKGILKVQDLSCLKGVISK